MEGDVGPLDAGPVEPLEQCLREVEACGRRRDRSRFAGVHRLVALAVEIKVGALDVGRQGHVSDRLYEVGHARRTRRPEPDFAPSAESLFQDLAVQRVRAALEHHLPPGLEPLSWMDQRFPAILGRPRHQQAFDVAPARQPAPQQARRKHPRVVEHEQIAASEMPRKRGNRGVFDRAGAARQHEQSRSSALGGRVLGDEIGRQFEGEVRNQHGGFSARGSTPGSARARGSRLGAWGLRLKAKGAGLRMATRRRFPACAMPRRKPQVSNLKSQAASRQPPA